LRISSILGSRATSCPSSSDDEASERAVVTVSFLIKSSETHGKESPNLVNTQQKKCNEKRHAWILYWQFSQKVLIEEKKATHYLSSQAASYSLEAETQLQALIFRMFHNFL